MPEGDPIALDEFTSVVDRTVAQIASHATQKAVRRMEGRKLVVASPATSTSSTWLQPDWVYRPDTGSFEEFPRGRFNARRSHSRSPRFHV